MLKITEEIVEEIHSFGLLANFNTYIHKETGRLIFLPKDESEIWGNEWLEPDQEEVENNKNSYLYIEPMPSAMTYKIMLDFASFVPWEATRERLFDALDGKGAFGRFRHELGENELFSAYDKYEQYRLTDYILKNIKMRMEKQGLPYEIDQNILDYMNADIILFPDAQSETGQAKVDDCLICERISEIKQGKNENLICELETAYVVLGDVQFYKGYTLLLSKEHKSELHELEAKNRMQFLKEMSIVAEAVYNVFEPKKLNYELLGNRETHLHWHIFPRHENDPDPHNPVWLIPKKIRDSRSQQLPKKVLNKMRSDLRNEIHRLLKS